VDGPARARRIDSPSNPAVKEASALIKKRSTAKGDAFLVEGMNLVEAAMRSSSAWLGSVFHTPEFAERHKKFFRSLQGLGADMYECAPKVLAKLSTEKTPQGLVGVVKLKPSSFRDISGDGPVVISDGIQDPGNMGTLIRTADAVGAVGIVLLSGSCDPLMPKALRASAGSALHMPLVYSKMDEAIGALKSLGYKLCAASASEGDSLFETDLRGQIAFIFGNEGSGISKYMSEATGFHIHVPIMGEAESLNVGASAAVILFEHLRQNLKDSS
jgi:TrmH family RNA methyltransferase